MSTVRTTEDMQVESVTIGSDDPRNPSVVVGGAFGFLCPQLGLPVDYLNAVEVVTVAAGGYEKWGLETPDIDALGRAA